jgi:glycolate oxidase FAD binding subunit
VVKNVAGYDLMKVMTGSFGTLGIIVEAACKMRPIPPGYQVAIAGFSTIGDAFEAVQTSVRAAALFHCDVLSPAPLTSFAESTARERFVLFAGFGGIRAEVDHQRAGLRSALGDNVCILEESTAETAYRALRDLVPEATVAAQIAVRPAELARCLEGCDADFRGHALSGVAQIFHKGADDPVSTVANWRDLAHAAGGHLRVIAAPPELRSKFAIFDTPAPPAMALMRRLKGSFDPHNIFNPGCFVGGL